MNYTVQAAGWARAEVIEFCENYYPGNEQYNAGEQVDSIAVFFETMAEAPLVFSFVFHWGGVIAEYIDRNYPDLFDQLENDLDVTIPDDLRLIVERLILGEELLEKLVEYVVGESWFIDVPTGLAKKRIDDEIEKGIESKREIYRSKLELMRLINRVLAKMFPKEFRVIRAAASDIKGVKALLPGQTAWSYRRQTYLTRVAAIFLHKMMILGFPAETPLTLPIVRKTIDLREELRLRAAAKGITYQIRDILEEMRNELSSLREALEGLKPEDLVETEGSIDILALYNFNRERSRRLWRNDL